MFNVLAVAHFHNINHVDRNGPTRCGNTHKTAQMRSSNSLSSYYLVSFSDLLVDFYGEIRNRTAKDFIERMKHPLGARWRSQSCSVVDEVRCHQLTKSDYIALSYNFGVKAPHHFLISLKTSSVYCIQLPQHSTRTSARRPCLTTSERTPFRI